jgi:hypothetical protein
MGRVASLVVFACATGLAGCTGAGGTTSSGGGGGGSTSNLSCQPDRGIQPGPAPMRRLTRFEYNNTVRDLVGDATRPADAFPAEEVGNGFGNDAGALTVSRLLAEQYVSAAKGVADRLIVDTTRFPAMLGCDPGAGEEACAGAFVDSFGARAYRRPLAMAEKERHLSLYRQVRGLSLDFSAAVGAVVQAMLLAPAFLYRVEFGVPMEGATPVVKLDHYEMASRLSYLLWGSMPDATLFAAAQASQLGTAAEVRAQALRMLGDPRAREVVRYFNNTLFGLAGVERIVKNPQQFPELTSAIPFLLKQESERFLDHVIWEGAGDLKTIFTATFSFMNAELARYYGVAARPNAPAGTAFQRIDLDPARAAGLLTHGALMASLTPGTQTNPVLRGLFVRRNLLCAPPPPPPPALMVKEPEPDPSLTTRERFKAHAEDPNCYPCHRLLDPIGYTFEHYDPIGRWRDIDNGKPVDSKGEIVGVDVAGPVNDAVELAGRLAMSRDVEECVVGQWLTFGYGRSETPQDVCTRASLERAFAASGGRIQDLLVALTQTDAFLYRPAVTP